jgi:hypothetical protein
MLPEVHFGSLDQKPIDWRKRPDNAPDDDAELPKTPSDVVDILGFDPLKETSKNT